ncbi:MAG: hypothetical protein M3P18_13385 [Actinomycetota bacterium]|nr:hypothetical protein [Actinomycetota bacterium]
MVRNCVSIDPFSQLRGRSLADWLGGHVGGCLHEASGEPSHHILVYESNAAAALKHDIGK